MIKKIEHYIQQHHMLAAGDVVAAGVSGGADSVCLLFLLKELQKKFSIRLMVVHVNHGIRPEAGQDELYVKKLCEQWEIPFFAVHADVHALAKEQGISEEEAGRNLRYRTFEEVLKREAFREWERGKARIAVAHNSNDRAETMLFNLFRGTGIRGLCSIQPIREKIIRPLLCVTRSEIEAFLREKGINYCIDSTNGEDTYTRNKIRNHLFPYIIEQISPASVEHMNHAANILSEARDYLSRQTEAAFKRCLLAQDIDSVKIDTQAFIREDSFIQDQLLLSIMEKLIPARKDITAVHINAIHGLMDAQGSKSVDLPYGFCAIKEYNELSIYKKQLTATEKKEEFKVEIPGSVTLSDGTSVEFSVFSCQNCDRIPENKYTKWFDYDKINKSLIIRKRASGDYLTINEALSKKSLKEYMIHEKIPKSMRDDIWVLAEEQSILWVMGYRISSKYKIDKNTKRILQVQLIGGETWQNM